MPSLKQSFDTINVPRNAIDLLFASLVRQYLEHMAIVEMAQSNALCRRYVYSLLGRCSVYCDCAKGTFEFRR